MTLIFDFDGTIVRSKRMCFLAFNRALKKHGYQLSKKKIMASFGPPAEGVIKNLLGIRNRKLIRAITDEVAQYKQTKGINQMFLKEKPHFFKKLSEQHDLILRTNADKDSTYRFLQKHNIFSVWREIVTPKDPQGKNKVLTLKYFKKKYDSPFIYVGDMSTDILAARKAKMPVIAISGWESMNLLKKFKPDFLIRRLSSIRRIIKNNFNE